MILALAACAREAEKHAPVSGESTPRPAASRVAAVPYRQIGDVEQVRTGAAGYRSAIIRIAVGVGHAREQIHETLRQVAEITAQKEKAAEVLVFAYRSASDVPGPYNVARAAYDRDWQLGIGFEPGPFVVDLDPSYLTAEQAPSAPEDRASSGITVVRESYGDRWPLPKHASATLDCETRVFRGTLRPFDIIELDGVRYGLNRTAVEVGGFPAAWPFIRDPFPPEHPRSAMMDFQMKIGEACGAKLHPTLP